MKKNYKIALVYAFLSSIIVHASVYDNLDLSEEEKRVVDNLSPEGALELTKIYILAEQKKDSPFLRALFEKSLICENLPEAEREMTELNLAQMYLHGFGGEKRLQQSRVIFNKLKDSQCLPQKFCDLSRFNFAEMCLNAEGGDKDEVTAFTLLSNLQDSEVLSSKKRARTYYLLALMCGKGIGSDVDLIKALYFNNSFLTYIQKVEVPDLDVKSILEVFFNKRALISSLSIISRK